MAIEILDARAARWPTPLRWLYVGMKWTLVAMGTWVFLGLMVQRAGWGVLWFLGFPLAFGIWEGITWLTSRPGSAAPSHGPAPD